MFYESLIILNISTLNFSEGVPASVLVKHLFLTFFLKKSQKYKFWKKNHRKSWIFGCGTEIQIVSAGILS